MLVLMDRCSRTLTSQDSIYALSDLFFGPRGHL